MSFKDWEVKARMNVIKGNIEKIILVTSEGANWQVVQSMRKFMFDEFGRFESIVNKQVKRLKG